MKANRRWHRRPPASRRPRPASPDLTPRLLELTRLVSRLMTFTEPTQLIEAMAEGLQAALGVDAVALWMHNAASHRYILMSLATSAGANIASEDREILQALQVRSGESLVGRVVSENASQELPSPEAYRAAFGALGRRREALFARWRSLLPARFSVTAMPMGGNGKPLAVVELFCSERPLIPEQNGWLRLYLDQLAQLLNLVRGQVDAGHQRRRLAALDAVVTAISTSSDLPDLLHVSLLVLMENVGATGGAICLISPGEQHIRLSVSHTLPPGEMVMLNSSQANQLLEDVIYYGQPTMRPVLSGDADSEDELLGRAAMPLLAGGTVVGVLILYGPLNQLTAAVDWPALVSVGSQIGIAVANTRLYEESQRERQRLSTVIESIADGVAICNGSGELILANETAATLLGLSSLPTLTYAGTDDARTLNGEPIEVSMSPLARALAGEVFRDYRLVVRGANGQNTVLSFSGAPLRSSPLAPNQGQGERDGAVVVFRDITEQRRLDEAKDEFLAVAAHELRSPLAAIKGYSDLLLRRETKNGAQASDLRGHQILNQQVNVMVQLVDNLLDVSRIDAGRLVLQSEAVDLTGLAESVIVQARSTAINHTFSLDSVGPVLVQGDSLRVRQVITNLVTNAIRYSPINTHVTLHVHADTDYGYLMIDDEGPGIPVGQREHLFERYYRVPGIKRTGSSTEGLGLGLYLCREIVNLHEGRIWVESAPGGGARFQVALPLYVDEHSPTQTTLDLEDLLFGGTSGGAGSP